MRPKKRIEMMTEQQSPTDGLLGKEIEDLDREAREALDRLADKREELERSHRATDLAASRQREREEEWRLREREGVKECEERRRAEELECLGKERFALEERAEQERDPLTDTTEG